MLRLTVQYDGGAFAGWQVQPAARTVQGVLEEGVRALVGVPVRVQGASRTDTGVHARAQVVALDPPRPLPMTAWVHGLNAHLPEDVAVLNARPAPPGFDPRRWARGKRYVYRIWNGPTRAPLDARWAWALYRPLDLEAMARAAAAFVGEHDFRSLQAAGCAAETSVRRLDRVEVGGRAGGLVEVTVEGTAFLRHMVRILVGTLVEVGVGRRPAEEAPRVLAARDRASAGRTAPGEGLTLEAVWYAGDS